MKRPAGSRRRNRARRAPTRWISLPLLALLALLMGGPFGPGWTVREAAAAVPVQIDYVYPEAFRDVTWIDVDLPANVVVVKSIRVLTANRSWTLKLCGSRTGPTACTTLVSGNPKTAPGWKGDFLNTQLNYSYTDLDGVSKLHFQVTPAGGDWMIFRIQTEVQP
jgi:hypothetical protein